VPLDTQLKKEIIASHANSEGDTGSSEVQIALLTRRINDLNEHLTSTTTTAVAGCCCSWGAAGAC